MSPELRQLISYRVERARESLDEARFNFERGSINLAANRLYYAVFYAVGGLLLAHQMESTKHSGVRALFIQHFIKTGRFPREYSDLYNKLFKMRTDADYADLTRVPASFVSENLRSVERFINVIAEELKTMGYTL